MPIIYDLQRHFLVITIMNILIAATASLGILILNPVFAQNVQPDQQQNKATTFQYSYEAGLVLDDNVSRAKYQADIQDDTIASFSVGVKSSMPLSDYTRLTLGGRVEAEKYDVFGQLDNVKYFVDLKYQFAFGSGFSSPTYALKLSLGGIESKSDIRTSETAHLGIGMNKWLTTTINLSSAYTMKVREAETEVFDTRENQIMLNLDVDISSRQLIYLSYHFIDGDVVTSATPKPSTYDIAQVSEQDDAFKGLTTNQWAYRIDARSQVFTVGYNAAVNRQLSVDISYQTIDSQATESDQVYYDRGIIRASVLGRF